MDRVLLGFIVGILLLPAIVLAWLYRGKVPVAVSDPPLPHERELASIPLRARINRELIQMPPIQPDEHVYLAGARIYASKCAACHGFHGKPAPLGQDMFPAAPPLWEKHASGPAVGVSDDEPGETYWKIANGIRLTGMPEFRTELSNDEMWQVTLLLAHADKPLPPAALALVRGESAAASAAPAAAPAVKKAKATPSAPKP